MPKSAGNHTIRATIEIRQLILTGALPGGMRLHEVPLAEALSRTPVREAMGRLAEEGFLVRASGGGYAVRSFGLADILDLIELLGVLEGTAARLAAERGPLSDRVAEINSIMSGIDDCLAADGPLDCQCYVEKNSAFHDAIAGLAGSEVIRREVERVTRLTYAAPPTVTPQVRESEALRHILRNAQEQHRALLGAILAREGSRAEAIAREHARAVRFGLEELCRNEAERTGSMLAAF